MVERQRNQRDFDGEAGREHRQHRAADPRRNTFVALHEEVSGPFRRVKGDDRSDRGEAQLEACSSKRLGLDQQDCERCDGEKPHAERFPSKRYSGQDEKRDDAASDRRNLGTRQQGVSDARDCTDGSGHEDEVETKRQPLRQSEQFQGQQHCRSDRRSDVKTANAEQMREPAPAHGVGVILADRILIAVGKSRRNSSRRAGKPFADMPSEPVSELVEAVVPARRQQLHRVEGAPDRSDLPEPGVAREIVGSGKSHRRGPGEPRPNPHLSVLRQPGRHVFGGGRHAYPRRKIGIGRRNRQPDVAFRDQRFDLLHLAVERRDRRPFDSRARNDRGARPYQGAAQGHCHCEPPDCALRATAADGETRHRQAGRNCEERNPLHLEVEREPGRDSGAEADHRPGWQLCALRLEKGLQPFPARRNPRPPIAPSPLWKRRTLYVRGARPLHCTTETRGFGA